MSSHVAHQFDDAQQQFRASQLGMWIFLATEVLFFGGMFTLYTVYRWEYPEAFAEGSRQMNLRLGTINTAVLLLSSLTMALAVRNTQIGDRRHAMMLLLVTAGLGLAFLGIKGFEYYQKFTEHLVPGTGFRLEASADPSIDAGHVQLLFSLYFGMTGLHAAHMLVGVGLVSTICWATHRGRFSADYYTPVEMTGLYWHFVDIIWVFLFPLLYLIR